MEYLREVDKLFNNFTPLAINHETRWKSKAMQKEESSHPGYDSEEVVLAKLKSILNKLSWTNLEKLTPQFLESLGSRVEHQMIQTSLRLVAKKASLEPHFGPLYARLAVKLAYTHKAFKKWLLAICKEEFDEQTQKRGADKKELIGLTKFIGELYLQKLIKGPIILGCCSTLLQNGSDESKMEAASHILTIVGRDLDEEQPPGLTELWERVSLLSLPGPECTSRRIQFLLQGVLEIRENKWVNIRHQQERAMTIAQVHAQVASEAKKGPLVSTSALRRSRSSEGFVDRRKQNSPIPSTPIRSPLRRVRSEAPSAKSTLQSSLQKAAGYATPPRLSSIPTPDHDQAAKKFVSALRDYFVHGDSKEFILGVNEAGLDDGCSRVSALSSGVLHVLEKKEIEVKLFLDAVDHCVRDGCVATEDLGDSLVKPLDFLLDLEIDAPLAPKFLAMIVSHWLPYVSLSSVFQKTSESFRDEGRPTEFFSRVRKISGENVTVEDREFLDGLLESNQ